MPLDHIPIRAGPEYMGSQQFALLHGHMNSRILVKGGVLLVTFSATRCHPLPLFMGDEEIRETDIKEL